MQCQFIALVAHIDFISSISTDSSGMQQQRGMHCLVPVLGP